jgi:hypothetical protein
VDEIPASAASRTLPLVSYASALSVSVSFTAAAARAT